MDITDCISSRRSARKFKEKPIDPEDVMMLIDAARQAPSAGNQQAWKFILVKDEKKRKELADAAYQQHWMAEAPLIIVVLGMTEEVKRNYGVRGEMLYSIQNCAMAAQNILLRAEDLGLGTCAVGAFNEDMVKRILDIPDEMRSQMLIPVGTSKDEPEKKLLKSLESMTYFEGYGARTESFDEAFYVWSGIIRSKAMSILKKCGRGYRGLKDQIHEKFN